MTSCSALSDDDLLAAVQSRPPIYDRLHRDHCNRELLKRLWGEISDELGVDVMLCKTRWNSMRDYFLRKYREGTRPGKPMQNGKRVWPYFDLLAFLIPHVYTNREPNSNGQTNVDIKDGSCDMEDSGRGSVSTTENTSLADIPAKIELPDRSPSPVDSETNKTIPSLTPIVASRPQSFSRSHGINTASPRLAALARKRKASNSVSDHRTVKIIKREENSHEHFFKSIQPMLEKFSDIETLLFRSEVNNLVLKYLQKQPSSPAAAHPEEETSEFSVYLQQQSQPSPE